MEMTSTNDASGRQTVAAFFDSSADAEKAKADLMSAGFKVDDITTSSGVEHSASVATPDKGIMMSLLDIFIFMPAHEKPTYEEAMRRGGVAVAVKTDAGTYERAIDILDRDGAIDLDERAGAWTTEGWSPKPARAGGPGSAEQAGFEAQNNHDPLVNPSANRDVRERIGTGTADMTAATAIDPPNALNARMAEPTRDLSHGRRRVRSYTYGAADLGDGVDPRI